MSDQTTALRLAMYWTMKNDQGEYICSSLDLRESTAIELRRLHAENERLAAEVANRNRRAIDGDEAVVALDRVHTYYEGIEALNAELVEALDGLITVTAHLDPCPGALEIARAALAKAGEQE